MRREPYQLYTYNTHAHTLSHTQRHTHDTLSLTFITLAQRPQTRRHASLDLRPSARIIREGSWVCPMEYEPHALVDDSPVLLGEESQYLQGCMSIYFSIYLSLYIYYIIDTKDILRYVCVYIFSRTPAGVGAEGLGLF